MEPRGASQSGIVGLAGPDGSFLPGCSEAAFQKEMVGGQPGCICPPGVRGCGQESSFQ